MPVHRNLEAITRGHFEGWLGLFRQTLPETAQDPLAVDYLMQRANRIACSPQVAIFDRLGSTVDAPPGQRTAQDHAEGR